MAYYERVLDRFGADRVKQSYRLFMAPGMAHCGGGDGPNQFDALAALERWVEHGQAPDSILASQSASGRVVRTRPLCPYPLVAVYSGVGSVEDGGSFTCSPATGSNGNRGYDPASGDRWIVTTLRR